MKENKMGVGQVRGLIWSMGLPMILSMVLQALYNVVDTMFVINMGAEGALGNLALSAAFPVQIMMIAIGVGTGVGINALLSKRLGEGNRTAAGHIAGNGLFLAAVFFVLFFLFGWFLAEPYMRLMSEQATVIAMGSEYLRICCCLSIGSIGYAIAERFLMATGRTLHSMVAQVAGAVSNILLDYVFIYPLGMGIRGAAYATVIGQCVSLLIALLCHYTVNREIDGAPRYLRPRLGIVAQIYRLGLPAFLMQAMLSLMMFGVLLIIGTVPDAYTVDLLSGSYGIYYKLMQIALFAAFGLSNTLISLLSFNFGRRDADRVRQTVRYGLISGVIVSLVLTALFQLLAEPIATLFALTVEESAIVSRADMIAVCETALHIATLGYVFMGFSVAVQGLLQGFGEVYSPLAISALRLLILVLPLVYLFTRTPAAVTTLWWAFPIAEVVTAAVAALCLVRAVRRHGIGEQKA